MKVERFPVPVSKIRECLHHLNLWPICGSKERIYLTDIRESYRRTILACHPDSRESTCRIVNLPAVKDVVDSYRQLVTCFGKESCELKYIDKKSLHEIGRFSTTPEAHMFKGGRFKNFSRHDEWSDCLDDQYTYDQCRHRQTHHHIRGGKTYGHGGYCYEVKEASRFSPRKKSPTCQSMDLKNEGDNYQPPRSPVYKSSHFHEDTGFWYSKDVLRPEQKIKSFRRKKD